MHRTKDISLFSGFKEHFYPYYFSTFTLSKIAMHSLVVLSQRYRIKRRKIRDGSRQYKYTTFYMMGCFETYFDAEHADFKIVRAF